MIVMGLFGFGEEKKAAKKEPVWVAPTTGNEYYEGEDLPDIFRGGIFLGAHGFGDDWIDRFMPEHIKQNQEVNQQISEIHKMMKTIIEQNINLQEKVKELEAELHQR